MASSSRTSTIEVKHSKERTRTLSSLCDNDCGPAIVCATEATAAASFLPKRSTMLSMQLTEMILASSDFDSCRTVSTLGKNETSAWTE